jgi:hypothetical protein
MVTFDFPAPLTHKQSDVKPDSLFRLKPSTASKVKWPMLPLGRLHGNGRIPDTTDSSLGWVPSLCRRARGAPTNSVRRAVHAGATHTASLERSTRTCTYGA